MLIFVLFRHFVQICPYVEVDIDAPASPRTSCAWPRPASSREPPPSAFPSCPSSRPCSRCSACSWPSWARSWDPAPANPRSRACRGIRGRCDPRRIHLPGRHAEHHRRQIDQESNWNPKAGSSAGAQGIAQFMPSTWRPRARTATATARPTSGTRTTRSGARATTCAASPRRSRRPRSSGS